jgi:hypothetical protein
MFTAFSNVSLREAGKYEANPFEMIWRFVRITTF